MREFTKSMTSYTWAMSLFGLQQMINIFRPAKATESFNRVTKATEEQFGDALKATFRAGDNLQKGFVDVTSPYVRDVRSRRRRLLLTLHGKQEKLLRQSGRVVSQAVDAVTQTVQSATSAAAGAAQQSAGWAAMPSMAQDTRRNREVVLRLRRQDLQGRHKGNRGGADAHARISWASGAKVKVSLSAKNMAAYRKEMRNA